MITDKVPEEAPARPPVPSLLNRLGDISTIDMLTNIATVNNALPPT
jgi:hypothetical protein